MVCTYGMYWCLMVFDGGLLAGCDVQEWIGSLARRGICLLHLVDEEVRIFVWLCQSVTCKAKAWAVLLQRPGIRWSGCRVIWCQELSLLEGRVGHIRRILPGSAARCPNSTSSIFLCLTTSERIGRHRPFQCCVSQRMWPLWLQQHSPLNQWGMKGMKALVQWVQLWHFVHKSSFVVWAADLQATPEGVSCNVGWKPGLGLRCGQATNPKACWGLLSPRLAYSILDWHVTWGILAAQAV